MDDRMQGVIVPQGVIMVTAMPAHVLPQTTVAIGGTTLLLVEPTGFLNGMDTEMSHANYSAGRCRRCRFAGTCRHWPCLEAAKASNGSCGDSLTHFPNMVNNPWKIARSFHFFLVSYTNMIPALLPPRLRCQSHNGAANIRYLLRARR